MLIFLCVLGEIVTIGLTSFIAVKGVLDIILEISKNGYKVDKRVVEEFQRKQNEIKRGKSNIFTRILGMIIFLTPGVNVLKTAITVHKWKKEVMSDEEVRENIIPMTDEEKEQYSKLEGYFEKLSFSSFVIDKENEAEFVGLIGGRTIVADHGLTSIYDDELLPLNYTLDEVKRLNEATGFSYRIGKMDDKNIAIIGIPNSDTLVYRLRFKSENYDVIHDYQQMTEEEAQDKTFTIYPFTIRKENEEDVNRIIEEIKQSRIESATKANLDALQEHSKTPDIEVGYVETEDMMSKEQGPSLKRKF